LCESYYAIIVGTVDLYDKQIKEMKDQRALLEKDLADNKKLLKRQRTKTTITGLVGILVSVGAFLIGSGK